MYFHSDHTDLFWILWRFFLSLHVHAYLNDMTMATLVIRPMQIICTTKYDFMIALVLCFFMRKTMYIILHPFYALFILFFVGGQKLTFLSNQPVSTLGSAPQQLTKAFVKFQLGSVASTSSSNATTTVCNLKIYFFSDRQ